MVGVAVSVGVAVGVSVGVAVTVAVGGVVGVSVGGADSQGPQAARLMTNKAPARMSVPVLRKVTCPATSR